MGVRALAVYSYPVSGNKDVAMTIILSFSELGHLGMTELPT